MVDLTESSDGQKKRYLNECVTTLVNQIALYHAQPLSETAYNSTTDGIFVYACSVIWLGLMARDFSDATKKADEDKTIRRWNFFMQTTFFHIRRSRCDSSPLNLSPILV